MPTAAISMDAWPDLPVRGNRTTFVALAEAWRAIEKTNLPKVVQNAQASYNNAVESADAAADSIEAKNLALAAAAQAILAPATNSNSTTSLALTAGTKSFATEAGKDWAIGQNVTFAYRLAPAAQRMSGIILSYDKVTGAGSFQTTVITGSGTYADWVISSGADAAAALTDFTDIDVSGTSHAAVAGTRVRLLNAAATTVTLPAAPAANAMVQVLVRNGLFVNYVARNGQTIESLAEDMQLDRGSGLYTFKFIGSTWRIIG